jgi:hypothetical protein
MDFFLNRFLFSEKSDIGKLAKTLSKSQKELFNKQIQKEELEPKKRM